MSRRQTDCPETIYGFHTDPDRDGKCMWCRQKISYPLGRPKGPFRETKTNLEEAYGYFYDPDHGIEKTR